MRVVVVVVVKRFQKAGVCVERVVVVESQDLQEM